MAEKIFETAGKVTVRTPLVPRLADGTPAVVLLPGAHPCFLGDEPVYCIVIHADPSLPQHKALIVPRETVGCDGA